MDSTTRLTLIQQNDTHAQMEPHWEHFWRNGRPEYRHAGGYARAATIVRRIKEETDGSAILVDCGDTLHGTGPAQWTQGAAVVPALNAMGVELMTPGNWEFGFGPDVLRERAAEMAFPLIACNVERAATSEAEFPPPRCERSAGRGLVLSASRRRSSRRRCPGRSARAFVSPTGSNRCNDPSRISGVKTRSI